MMRLVCAMILTSWISGCERPPPKPAEIQMAVPSFPYVAETPHREHHRKETIIPPEQSEEVEADDDKALRQAYDHMRNLRKRYDHRLGE
jgi:hypothetical protein